MDSNNQKLLFHDDDMSFIELYEVIKSSMIGVILTGMILAIVAYIYAAYAMKPVYESSAILIVNNRRSETESAITFDEITSAQNLAAVYSIIIKSQGVLSQVVSNVSGDLTINELASKITVSAVDDTQVINVAVKDNNPNLALVYTEEIVAVTYDIILDLVGAGSMGVVSTPQLPIHPVSPNVPMITAMGFAVGLILSMGVVLLNHILDKTYQSPDYIADELGIPVLGVIPNFESVSRGKR